MLAGDPVDALSMIVHRDRAYAAGRTLTDKLRQKLLAVLELADDGG